MFHAAAKVLFFLFQPSSLAVLLTALGVVLLRAGRRRAGSVSAAAGMAWLVGAGLLPVGNILIYPLEERFSVPSPAEGQAIAGIIMLGGFEDPWVSSGRGSLNVNEAAERLTESVRLAKRWPDAKVVFTGGWGGLLEGVGADGAVGAYLRDMGVMPERLILEGRSRNTFENAVFTRDLVAPQPGTVWLLVTSASHMPRAVGAFRQVGFDVLPFPVDFRTRDRGDMLRFFTSVPDGLKRCDLAVHEWLGLLMYWLTGRSNALYPAPVP
ncbi:MAG TPA: YdcF family protein [Hyphomicrobium sp.]|nr:YdcF family protein [Hyphomicrobium sp.]